MTQYHQAERATDPCETTVAAWVSRDLANNIAQLARENDRSVSGEIRIAIRRHLAISGGQGLMPRHSTDRPATGRRSTRRSIAGPVPEAE